MKKKNVVTPYVSMASQPYVDDKNNFKLTQYHDDNVRMLLESNENEKYLDYMLKTTKILDEFMSDPPHERKRQLVDDYCMAIGATPPCITVDRSSEFECSHCGGYMISIPAEASLSCEECGTSVTYQDESINTASFEQIKHVVFKSQFTYERISHFKEEIDQCQGLESTIIPQSVLDTVLVQCMKDKRDSMRNFKKQDMREILKRCSLSVYYKNSVLIIHQLGGNTGLNLSGHTELLYIMFAKIQAPFEKYQHLLDACRIRIKSKRRNFLNRNFTLRKCLELLDFPDSKLEDLFPYLKNKTTLMIYDQVWKLICGDVGWKYIPSINELN